MTSAPLRYRPDVDGLRALAVGSVVLYHADHRWLPGGFSGVDVFFVISGYLITRIIVADLAQERFSLRGFYERRARRILPALCVVALAASLAAIAWLPPAELERFGRSLAATALFASNFHFWRETGYFEAPAQSMPLLHTWSLAVEEQFYVLFPPLLALLLARAPRSIAPLLGLGMLASFGLAEWGAQHRPSAAFYLGPTRAWELLCGIALALGLVPKLHGRSVSEALGALGLVAIVAGFILLSGDSRFPGVGALLPCLGAMLVIHSAEARATLVSRLLSARAVVFVGLISYSLYLWHWVLFVYARHLLLRELTLVEKLGLIGASVLVATLCWRYVELPLRRFRPREAPRRRMRPAFVAAAAASLALLATGLALQASQGLPGRFSPAALAYARSEQSYWPHREACESRLCELTERRDGRPAVLLWGDSHAAALAPAVAQLAQETDSRAIVAYKTVCAPLLGFRDYGGDANPYCDGFIDEVLEFVERERVERVLLHARWAWYVEGSRNEETRARHIQLAPDMGGPDANGHAFLRMLVVTIGRLQQLGVTVDVVTGVPEVGFSAPELAWRSVQFGKPLPHIPRASFERRQRRSLALIREATQRTSAGMLELHPLLCDEARCSIVRNDRVLYHDDDHLSLDGAREIRQALGPAFTRPREDATVLR